MVEDTQDAPRRLREQDADRYADVPAYCFPDGRRHSLANAYEFATAHGLPNTHRITLPDGYSFTVPNAHYRGVPNPGTHASANRESSPYGSTIGQWWRLLGQPTRR